MSELPEINVERQAGAVGYGRLFQLVPVARSQSF